MDIHPIPGRKTPTFLDATGSRGRDTSMPRITKSLEVGAPVEKVFEMLDDPENFPVYVPIVTKVSNIRRSDKRLGDSFDVVYSMMGMDFNETFTYSEYAKPRRLAARYEGRMTGSMGITSSRRAGRHSRPSTSIMRSVPDRSGKS